MELADRIRALVGAELALEEKRMFGSRAFLVDGKILAASRGGGVLLIRVGDEQGAVLVGRPGATVERGFADLRADLAAALARVHGK